MRLLNIDNKVKVAGGVVGGGWGKWARGIKGDTCWDEHWVLYVGAESLDSTPEVIFALGCKFLKIKNFFKEKC